MKELKLTKGLFSLVDDEDYVKALEAGKWCVNGNGYAYNSRHGLLHRFLLGLPREKACAGRAFEVDHIDRDKLNNQKANLRIATLAENRQYRQRLTRKKPSKVPSRFKGVTFSTSRQHWMAYIYAEGRRIHLGLFETDVEAAYAYNAAARFHFGEFAYQNQLEGAEPSEVRSKPKQARYAHRTRTTPLSY